MQVLRSLEFGQGSHVKVPIAVLIWLMIIPMMRKVDLVEVPVMLSICAVCNRTRDWFSAEGSA